MAFFHMPSMLSALDNSSLNDSIQGKICEGMALLLQLMLLIEILMEVTYHKDYQSFL